jgi:hypothetical protein
MFSTPCQNPWINDLLDTKSLFGGSKEARAL